MSSAIEVLKDMIAQYEAFTSQFPRSKLDKLDAEAKALGVALLALEKKENYKKEGAIQELEWILTELHENVSYVDFDKTMNKIRKRLLELNKQ